MQITPLHRWDLSPAEAVALQRELARRVDVRTPLPAFDLVAGADISYNKYDPLFFASVIVYRVSDGTLVETQDVSRLSTFPYVPGLLSFREAPALLDAFAKLKTRPDVIMIDGQGIAHPRRLGIASHIGLWLDFPTVGCAKSLLAGKCKPPDPAAGSLSPLMIGDEQVGYVVRTKNKVNPVFISAGHKIDLASAVKVVSATVRGYRIPEPTRQAHLRVNALRRGEIPITQSQG
jgi:deoxyribonuclease V